MLFYNCIEYKHKFDEVSAENIELKQTVHELSHDITHKDTTLTQFEVFIETF